MALEQNLSQEQLLQQQQVQRLTAQQFMQVKMLEMPLAQIEQNIKAELYDNPALEAESSSSDAYGDMGSQDDGRTTDEDGDASETDNFEAEKEKEDRDDALDSALESMGSDDSLGSDYRTYSNNSSPDEEQEEMVYGDTKSFYDKIMEQVADEELTERQREIMEYLVGSLDGDGFLRKDVASVCDELAVYHSLDCSEEEIREVLSVLQSFDPAGLGAADLRECLLLQIKRKEPSPLRTNMAIIVMRYFDEFTKKHYEKLRQHLRINNEELAEAIKALQRLNPRPGASLGETMGRSTQQITPDFIVDTTDDGRVTFQLNQGDIPRLYVSQDFEQQYKGFMANQQSLNRREKEALLFAKERIERARGYIEAIEKRRQTMTSTMQAIIDIQKKFFLDGDEGDLVPMTLKDVGDRVGLDISTVSRVCSTKYADTQWGIFRLKHFFTEGYNVADTGEEMSTRKIKLALADIINKENRAKPYSDEKLAKLLKEQGYPIARRTVAKYREQLGFPVARLRK